MKVILVRCAQGVVVFQPVQGKGAKSLTAICLNDGTSVHHAFKKPVDVLPYLQALQAKAQSLSGNVQQVVELDL